MSQHLTTYSFARLKITISFFLPNSLEYEMIVHRMYKNKKKTTATLGANHPRLYLFPTLIMISKLYKLLIWLQSSGTPLGPTPHRPNDSPGLSSSFVAPYRVHR